MNFCGVRAVVPSPALTSLAAEFHGGTHILSQMHISSNTNQKSETYARRVRTTVVLHPPKAGGLYWDRDRFRLLASHLRDNTCTH
jgi:hypothetical protein